MKPIVLFFQSTSEKSWKDKLTGVYAYAEKAGWQIQVIEATSSTETIREVLRKWNPIGCLVDRGMQNSKPPLHFFKNTPVVFLDPNPAYAHNCTSLIHNSSASIKIAVDEMLRLKLPRLAYVAWNKTCFWDQERKNAFIRSAKTNGFESYSFSLSDKIEEKLIQLPKPSGVICANDLTAQKVISESLRAGYDIPDDLAIIGIDNDEFICEHTSPTLTSVDPGFIQAGYHLAELLHQRILDPKLPHKHETYGPLSLVRRESSRWAPFADVRAREAIEFIHRNFAGPSLTVSRVVETMGCSRSLADILFRKTTGTSIMAEILRIRIENACKLLRNPRQKITAIASLCGYRSEPFFKRVFKRETGLTMREWRKQNATSRA